MKKRFVRQTVVILIVTILMGSCSGGETFNVNLSGRKVEAAVLSEKALIKVPLGQEYASEEPTVEEPTTEEPTSEDITSEEPTIEEPTTEEPTTEDSTTLDYEIINGVYKVKNGVLIEYLGSKTDQSVTSIIIPKNIQKIEKSVFSGYKYIKKVTFASGSKLKEIGKEAFRSCSALTSITLPKGLRKIGYRTFYKCSSLKKLTIPSTVTEGDRILGSSSAVTTVTFASGIKTIPSNILRDAGSVTGISIKSGVTTIGSKAFYKCTGLKKITIPSTVTKINTSAFSGCMRLTSVNMSKNVKTIESYAFKNCKNLKQMELRKAVTYIGKNIFSGNKSITLLVYANSAAKAYARKNKIKWQYTSSELKRRALSTTIYKQYKSLISSKYASKYKLKYLSDYVPQGTCVVGNYLIVSMYYKNLRKNSILLLYNKTTGKYVKKVVLPSRDHVGSITNVKGRLVVGLCNISITDYVAVISSSKLKKIKSGKTIKYDYVKKIPGYADFATFDGSIFWAGHCADISSPTMYGYTVKVKKKKLVFTKKYTYVVPANSQGLIVKKGKGSNRTFVFSQSYGRLNDSALITYSTKISTSKRALGKAKSIKALPPMAEGMYMTKGGNIYIAFESAAGLYCGNPDNTSEIKIKNLGKIKYSNLSKLKNK